MYIYKWVAVDVLIMGCDVSFLVAYELTRASLIMECNSIKSDHGY